MEVNILGTKYEIIYKTKQEDIILEKNSGYCDSSIKKIVIDKDIEVKSSNTVEKLDDYHKSVVRHEIMHAMFHESGMSDWEQNEILVDYIAIQFPKLIEIYEQLKCEK